MKRFLAATLSLTLLAATGSAFAAPPHHDDRDNRDRHDQRDDRDHGPSRGHDRHGLHAPKRGQQWRKVDDRYVLIAVATGLIADVVLNGR